MPRQTPLSLTGRLLASSQYHRGTNRLLTVDVEGTAHIYMMPVALWIECEKSLTKDASGDFWLAFLGYMVHADDAPLRFITSFQGVSQRNNEVLTNA